MFSIPSQSRTFIEEGYSVAGENTSHSEGSFGFLSQIGEGASTSGGG
jgi:hypothetical protein